MAKTAHAPSTTPRLFVLAGTNGAGKSSIGGATIRARGGDYFNPDEAAARIRQAQPHLSATQANSAAWHEGKRLLQHAIARGLDYNFETTLGGQSFATLLKTAADKGYEVRIWYVGLASPEQHLARVKARVKKGGHDIPEADIRRRFDQSRLQLITLLPSLHELRIYDNSQEADPHKGLAPRPCLVLHWLRDAAGRAQVLAPSAHALGATPAWAKPVVAAALKLAPMADAAASARAPAKAEAGTRASTKASTNAGTKSNTAGNGKASQGLGPRPATKAGKPAGLNAPSLAKIKPRGTVAAKEIQTGQTRNKRRS